jgi:aspartate beta-hydroxylase
MILPGLRSLPFWTSDARPNPNNPNEPPRRRIAYNDPSVTRVVELLESNADTIREEYLKVAPSLPSDYEGLQDHGSGKDGSDKDITLHEGDWDWHTYLSKGNVQGDFVMKFPETSKILNDGLRGEENNFQLFEGTPFGFCFFSNLGGGAKIEAHTAPTNLRLRIHLPIVVRENGRNPDTGLPLCGIRVATSVRSYEQDQALVLDDAYDHEVWNDTSENRVVLLVDIWHPDVTQAEKEAVVDMFQAAKRDGLWKR